MKVFHLDLNVISPAGSDPADRALSRALADLVFELDEQGVESLVTTCGSRLQLSLKLRADNQLAATATATKVLRTALNHLGPEASRLLGPAFEDAGDTRVRRTQYDSDDHTSDLVLA